MQNDASPITYHKLDDAEQSRAVVLLGRCFPEYWEQLALTTRRFPFREISFGAFSGEQLVGHCGILPYSISDGAGGIIHLGGIASVAVAPEFRKRGIAQTLCEKAIEWAKLQNMASLTLYTAFFHVYEVSGWELYAPERPRDIQFPEHLVHSKTAIKPVQNSTMEEQADVISLYENGEDFRGKVIRSNDDAFTSWKRLFHEPEFVLAHNPGKLYAILNEDNLLECFQSPDTPATDVVDFLSGLANPCTHTLTAHLPANSRIWQLLQDAGCKITPSHADVMHGEKPMKLDLTAPGVHDATATVHYPVGDKF